VSAIPRRRVALWIPLPPQRTGISEFGVELIEELSPLLDVEVFTDDNVEPESALTARHAIYPGSAFARRHAERPFDTCVYHLGNNATDHAYMYPYILAVPGVLFLHDLSLYDFYWELYWNRDRQPEFLDEVEFNYGPETRLLMPDALAGKLPIDRLDLRMDRRVVETSRAVVVHSDWGRATLSQRYPHKKIYYVPQGAPIVDITGRFDMRAQYGWNEDVLVVGVFGGWSAIKRLDVAVEAYRRLRRKGVEVRLVLAGRIDDQAYAERIMGAIRDAQLEDEIVITGELPIEELTRMIQATDVVLNLRWPTAGETSATMMRAFGAGKMVITSDVPQHRELDPSFCWSVPRERGAEIRTLLDLLTYAAGHLAEVRRAGIAAQNFMRDHASWEEVAGRHAEIIEDVTTTGLKPANTANDSDGPRATGVNVIGDLDAASGLGEATCSLVTAFARRGIPTSLVELPYTEERRTKGVLPSLLASLPRGSDHPINLLAYNVNVMHTVGIERLRDLTGGKYTIAYWFWELSRVPEFWVKEFDRVDEIWVTSNSARDSLLTVARTPVTMIPAPVEVITSPRPDRARFGLPADRRIFFYSFSATSCSGRKNPWGFIEGFRLAFGKSANGGPLLVLKVHHLDRFPELQRELRSAVARVGGVLIEQSFSRQQANDLLACSDAYVSLHRAEGFGLGMAESMYLGKPVIGTQYSANVDFMTPQNSYPVNYSLRAITADDHRFQPECAGVYRVGEEWAEPSVEEAAELMQRIYDAPEEARAKGEQAAIDIRRYCSPEVVAHQAEERLLEVENWLQSKSPEHERPVALSVPDSVGRPQPTELVQRYRIALESWEEARHLSECIPMGHRPVIGWMTLLAARLPVVGRRICNWQRLRYLPDITDRQRTLNVIAIEEIDALISSIPEALSAATLRSDDIDRKFTAILTEAQTRATRLEAGFDDAQRQLRGLETRLDYHLQALESRLSEEMQDFTSRLTQDLEDWRADLTASIHATEGTFSESLSELDRRIALDSFSLEQKVLGELQSVAALVSHRVQQLEAGITGEMTSTSTQVMEIADRMRLLQTYVDRVEKLSRTSAGLVRVLAQQVEVPSVGARSPMSCVLGGSNLEALLVKIEREVPLLARAQVVGFSVADPCADDLIMVAAGFFGQRLDAIGWKTKNDALYHVDFTEEWERDVLFDNAASKLISGGHLVVVTDEGTPRAARDHGMTFVFDRAVAAYPGTEARVRIWQRP
jgi:glycosyltransferase involved in cell wall biosynthesis